jgi:hypothetical protein
MAFDAWVEDSGIGAEKNLVGIAASATVLRNSRNVTR